MRQVSQDFEKQWGGFSLTTAEILYRLPDHKSILQTYFWQDYDMAIRDKSLESKSGFGALKDIKGAGTLVTRSLLLQKKLYIVRYFYMTKTTVKLDAMLLHGILIYFL